MGSLSFFALAACVSNDDKSEWNDGSQAINFTSSIQGLNTRAANAEWTAGDKVGIFMKAANGDLSAATAVNKLHTTDKNGNLTASNAENALYYPTDGSSVDFVAYYPYVISLPGNTYKVDVTTQTDKPAIDLLYSDNAKGFAKGASGSPQLTFAHMLSQIVFNIEKDATIPTLDGLKVTFKGMNTKADFTLADGKLINAGTVADITSLMAEGVTTVTTIVLPATTLSDIKVVFDLNGKSYTADYPQSVLDAGRKYVHKVKLSDSNGQPVIVMEAATITDWIEVPGGDIDVDFGGGSVTPGEVTLLDESFNGDQGSFTIDNKELGELSFVWNHSVYQEVGYMKASGFKSGTKYAAESWLVSPDVDLSKATKATLTFMHCDNNSGVGLEERQKAMSLWVAETTSESWEQATIPNYGAGTDYVYVSSGNIDLSKYAGKSIKFAFKYVSTSASSATWQIQNVKVIADGSGSVDPDPQPGEETVFIEEGFGEPVQITSGSSKFWPSVDAYDGWTDVHKLTYSDPMMTGSFSNANIRATSGLGEKNGHLWLAKDKDCSLKISGFNTTEYTNLKLTYDIAANVSGNQNAIAVITDKGNVEVPDKAITTTNTWQAVELTLPDGITFVQFTSSASTNKAGYRIDNVKLVGTSK